jgi:hypothetical protein
MKVGGIFFTGIANWKPEPLDSGQAKPVAAYLDLTIQGVRL